jgi:hypothetical protein
MVYHQKNKITTLAIVLCLLTVLVGCSPTRKFTANYYRDNDVLLQDIRHQYKKLYEEKPFALEFRDRDFKQIGFEIMTDSIKYIYSFNTDQSNLSDTLKRYGFNEKAFHQLISSMRVAQCTWISNVDYYELRQKKQFVFMSVRHSDLESRFKAEKYFTLVFFDRPQLFDDRRRLLDRTDKKNLRSINGEIFYRITDRVCYAFTGHFR